MGRGTIPSQVMLIGEAPGYREDDIGKPFQGRAGRLLDEELERIGESRYGLYITNSVRCRPPGNRKPKAREVDACSVWMRKEAEIVKPKFVLLLGATALRTTPFWRKSRITKIRGQIAEHDGTYYMATFHPAACLPGRDTGRERKLPVFQTDLKTFFKMVKEGKPPQEEDLNPVIVKTEDTFNQMLDSLRESDHISYDLETMGLRAFAKGRDIVTAGFGVDNAQWIMPINFPRLDGSNRSPFKTKASRKLAWDLVFEALKGKFVVTHNGKYDVLWAKVKYGHKIHISFDTMLAHYLLDENSPHGLKYLSSLHFGVPDWSSVSFDDDWWFQSTLAKLSKYHARDLYYTRKLYFIFDKMLREDPKLYRFYKLILLPAFRLFVDVEYDGMFMDKVQFTKAQDWISENIVKYLWELRRVDDAMNWDSPAQVGKKLFNDLGLPIISQTKTGKPSTAEAVLKVMAEPDPKAETIQIYKNDLKPQVHGSTRVLWWEGKSYEIADYILKYRAFKKLKTFIDSWMEHQVDGFIHANFKFLTVSGRLSCANPNMQNVPREKELRSIVNAPLPWVFVEADHSQVELRTVAMFANEPTMKKIFTEGGDIHIETATSLLDISPKDLTQEDRKKAKAVNFGLIYRMGWKKLKAYAREKYGVILTEREAKLLVMRFFARYFRLKAYYAKQERLVRQHGMVRHPLGRIRHLPNIYSSEEDEVQEAIRLAINNPVQGFASDYNLAGLVSLRKAIPRPVLRIVGAVHDSGLLWIHLLYLRSTLMKAQEIMEHPPILKRMDFAPSVPWKVDFKIGPWGRGTEIDPSKWVDKHVFIEDLKRMGLYKAYRELKNAQGIDYVSTTDGSNRISV